jgi:hypothetical protein
MRNEPVPGFRITDLTIFTTIGEDDEEGIPAFSVDTGLMPMVAADIRRLGQLRDIADTFRELGMTVTERHFDPAELADDLADVLSRFVVGWTPLLGHDLAQHPEVQRVMDRYREARGR